MVGTVGGSARTIGRCREGADGAQVHLSERVALVAAAAIVCGPLLTVIDAAGAGAATTTTTAPKPSTTTTTVPTPTTTTTPHGHRRPARPRRPAPAPVDHDDLGCPGARRPVDDHDHGAPARGQPAQPQRPDAPRRGAAAARACSTSQQRGVHPGNRPECPELPELPGRAVPLRRQRDGSCLLHGVNVVYKHAPYIAYPDPGEPWNFECDGRRQRCRASASTSCASASNGRRSSPDRVGPNQPKVCTPGAPGNAHEWNRAVAERYLSHVAATVKLLAQLRDLHPARHAPGRLQPELPG